MFSRCLKRSLCILLSCTVLIFSCVFMPRQRADAFVLAPVVGTVAGLFALGLLCYGVSTSADSDFVQDNSESWAASNGFFSYPTQSIMNTICSSLFLSSIKLYADLAYSSGVCSTDIEGPKNFTSLEEGFIFNGSFNYSTSKGESFYTTSSLSSPLFLYQDSTRYITIFSFDLSLLDSSSVFFKRFQYGVLGTQSLCTNHYYINSQIHFAKSTLEPYYAEVFQSMGIPLSTGSLKVDSYIQNVVFPSLDSLPGHVVDTPITAKPVIPGACDVFNSSKSLDSYHVDSPGNDVLDLGNLLDKTGCESIDDVVSKVYTGDLTASDVIGGLDCRPYVDVDVDTGTIAIPNETTNSRPISLDKDLSIPSDIADTDTYVPINPPLDDTSSDRTSRPSGSYTFPLSNFFPFCLPWDIYKVLSIFHTSPKAPVISIPLGSFFSDIPGVDKYTTDYVCTIDLGDENFKKWFQILRLLESIGIIVGFVLISRYLIHGGD